jgi:iron complex transport system substrate-binding protein
VGGHNVVARLIEDAGARYFLENDTEPKANLRIPFERALQNSFTSRVWIGLNGVNRVKSKGDLVMNAPQVRELGPIRAGDVYAMDLHMNEARYFPYTSESLDKPDLLLSDLVSILHPELLPGYQPAFTRKLE